MMQQLMTENRFISLAPDDPAERPTDDVSAASDGTEL